MPTEFLTPGFLSRVARLLKPRRLDKVQIAERLGVSVGQVRYAELKLGLARRENMVEKADRRLKARNDRIVRLYRSGLTAEKISLLRGIGVQKAAVLGVLRARGVRLRQPGDWVPGKTRKFLQTQAIARKLAPIVGTGPGTSASELAKKVGVPKERLRTHLRRIGGYRAHGGLLKLSVRDVAQIKVALTRDTQTIAEIAQDHGVTASAVWSIAAGKNWKDIPWPKGKRYVSGHGHGRIKPRDNRGGAILTFGDVARIKHKLVNTDRTFQQIGEEHGVSIQAVSHIADGSCWKDVPWPHGKRYVPRKPRKSRLT